MFEYFYTEFIQEWQVDHKGSRHANKVMFHTKHLSTRVSLQQSYCPAKCVHTSTPAFDRIEICKEIKSHYALHMLALQTISLLT